MSGVRKAHHAGSFQTRSRRVREAAYADPSTQCWRCGRSLVEEQARRPGRVVKWQAGHLVDGDSSAPLAAEHSTCNQSAGAVRGNQRRAAVRRSSVMIGPLGADRDVTLIVGPPGAGKSTLAASMPGVHLEREMFGSDVAYRAEVARVARAAGTVCTVIRTCPTVGEQLEWAALCGASRVVVVDPGERVCLERVAGRRRPSWRGEVRGVKEWYENRRGVSAPAAGLNPSRRWY